MTKARWALGLSAADENRRQFFDYLHPVTYSPKADFRRLVGTSTQWPRQQSKVTTEAQ